MNFFRIALSLYGNKTLFYAHVANVKQVKRLGFKALYCIFSDVIIMERGKRRRAEHEA